MLFRSVKVFIGTTAITNHDSNHGLIDYCHDLLNFDYANREQVLENKGFNLDLPGFHNAFDRETISGGPAGKGSLINKGAQSRLERFAECSVVAKEMIIDWNSTNGTGFFISDLNTDLLNLPFGIVPGNDVRLQFSLNPSAFLLMAQPDVVRDQLPIIQIVSMCLLVMARDLPPDSLLAIQRPIIQKHKATIQTFNRERLDVYQIAQGGHRWSVENFLSSADTGHKIFLAFVETSALENGNYQLSPLMWAKTFGVVDPNDPSKSTEFSIDNIVLSLDAEHIDGFKIDGGSEQINSRMHYQRFCMFSGTSASKIFCNGITYDEFIGRGG